MSNDFAFKYKILNLKYKFKKPIIGLGAQAKSSLALGVGKDIFISEPGSDLSSLNGYGKFEKVLKSFVRFAGVKDIAYDLHPGYNYRQLIYDYQFRKADNFSFFGIQHQQAHIAACMYEHNLKAKVIGVAFDGTGLGTDGNLWGGDFFSGGLGSFERVAHLRYMPLVGGQEAILEPWRIGAALLYDIYGNDFLGIKIGFLKTLDKKKWLYLEQMLTKSLNCPLSCSAGRLFDAASAILGLVKGRISREAEGPIKLEQIAKTFKPSSLQGLHYNYRIKAAKGPYVIDTFEIIHQIVSDLKKAIEPEEIAFKFHNTISRIILGIAQIERKATGINIVALSGGVFQNKLLSALARDLLTKKGFKIFEHTLFSPGDSSICLGQIILANSRG